MVGHGGSSAGSYLADPTSPIPSHCASIVATSTLKVNISYYNRSIRYKFTCIFCVDYYFVTHDFLFDFQRARCVPYAGSESLSTVRFCMQTFIQIKVTPSGVIEVDMLTHIYPHKPQIKIEVTICKITRLTAHFVCGLMPDMLICTCL